MTHCSVFYHLKRNNRISLSTYQRVALIFPFRAWARIGYEGCTLLIIIVASLCEIYYLFSRGKKCFIYLFIFSFMLFKHRKLQLIGLPGDRPI